MKDTIIKSKKVSSQDLGMPAEFWGVVKKANTSNRVYVRVFKNNACVDAFMSDSDKVEENVKRMYGNEATFKV